MTLEDFEKTFMARVSKCQAVLIGKNTEYARGGDKLSNFKKAAGRLGSTPEEALLGMETKHSISIVDLIQDLGKGIHHPMSVWDEKIGDELNYLFLLNALLQERYSFEGGPK